MWIAETGRQESQQLNARAANAWCLRYSLIQARWSSSARGLSRQCALSSAGAERVTPIPLRHANGCSPARRLLARASWRPQYPLLPKCTCRSPLATENSQVCRVVDREGATTLVTANFNNATMHQPCPFVYVSGWDGGSDIRQTPTQANLNNQIHALVHFMGALNYILPT